VYPEATTHSVTKRRAGVLTPRADLVDIDLTRHSESPAILCGQPSSIGCMIS
jgi:hypothetical protein